MDIDARKSAEREIQPDIMDISIDQSEAGSIDIKESTVNVALQFDSPLRTSLPSKDETEDAGIPYLLCRQRKTPFRVYP